MNNEPISPLRQRMLDAMAVRNFSDKPVTTMCATTKVQSVFV